jgi:transcriptional repressor NrdR
MNCPDCGHDETSIVDSRHTEGGNTVRRRRECTDCGFRYTTYERRNWNRLRVKKSDGKTEAYNEEKVRTGIELAVEKRPISSDKVSELTDEITTMMEAKEKQVIESDTIGAAVAKKLRKLDKVAFVRFVSVYKGYSEPEEFQDVLDSLLSDQARSNEEEQTIQPIDDDAED